MVCFRYISVNTLHKGDDDDDDDDRRRRRRRRRKKKKNSYCPIHPNTLQSNARCSFITCQQSQLEVIMNEGRMMAATDASMPKSVTQHPPLSKKVNSILHTAALPSTQLLYHGLYLSIHIAAFTKLHELLMSFIFIMLVSKRKKHYTCTDLFAQ
jgi:hypothetical protein